MPGTFLPVTPEEVAQLGWDAPDFVYAVGEAYVDHPSFGHAIIGRVLEAAGYRVAMLCLPEYHSAEAFKRFGRPKLGFLVSSGVIDSMVNHYTVARKRRNTDVYAPGGRAGLRPDRAVTVYCNRIHEAYPGIPVLIGGVEASLRRFSHYDYWDNKVRRSVLVDSAATLLLYGMGENTILDCCDWVRRGMPAHELPRLRGVCYMAKQPPETRCCCPPMPRSPRTSMPTAGPFCWNIRSRTPCVGTHCASSRMRNAIWCRTRPRFRSRVRSWTAYTTCPSPVSPTRCMTPRAACPRSRRCVSPSVRYAAASGRAAFAPSPFIRGASFPPEARNPC